MYYAAKSFRIFATPEQHDHIQKIIHATRYTYNWTLDILGMYPEINLFALYNRFTGHKNNQLERYSIVEVAYHQTAIKKAHTAFKNAQNPRDR